MIDTADTRQRRPTTPSSVFSGLSKQPVSSARASSKQGQGLGRSSSCRPGDRSTPLKACSTFSSMRDADDKEDCRNESEDGRGGANSVNSSSRSYSSVGSIGTGVSSSLLMPRTKAPFRRGRSSTTASASAFGHTQLVLVELQRHELEIFEQPSDSYSEEDMLHLSESENTRSVPFPDISMSIDETFDGYKSEAGPRWFQRLVGESETIGESQTMASTVVTVPIAKRRNVESTVIGSLFRPFSSGGKTLDSETLCPPTARLRGRK